MVAASLGLVRPHPLRRMALVQHVAGIEGLGDRGEIFVDPPDYAILNPVAPGLVNLGLVVPLAHAAPWSGRLETFFRARLKQLRHLAPRLAGMEPAGRLMAMGPLAYRVGEPRVGGVLLAGDAAGFYDPFTGEGLFTALRSAELLAETAHAALTRGDLSARALAGTRGRAGREFAAQVARDPRDPAPHRAARPGQLCRSLPRAPPGPARRAHGRDRRLRASTGAFPSRSPPTRVTLLPCGSPARAEARPAPRGPIG